MQTSRFTSCAVLCASLVSAAVVMLCGCSGAVVSTPVSNAISVTGNWQFTSTSASAIKLAALSGSLSGTSAAMTAVLHSNSATSCVAPSNPITLSGSTSSAGLTTLTSSNFPSGVLTISGNLAPDGKSLTGATYTVTGGTCAFAQPAAVNAFDYSPITGTFTGGFSDAGGYLITVNATLSQSLASDPNGNFTLSGSGTFPSNRCFNSPVPVSNTQVTGGSFTLTYADPATTNSVTASGTFSQDGKTLTVTNWTLTGPCGPDSGTGSLAQSASH